MRMHPRYSPLDWATRYPKNTKGLMILLVGLILTGIVWPHLFSFTCLTALYFILDYASSRLSDVTTAIRCIKWADRDEHHKGPPWADVEYNTHLRNLVDDMAKYDFPDSYMTRAVTLEIACGVMQLGSFVAMLISAYYARPC